jgi:hypothetical protein
MLGVKIIVSLMVITPQFYCGTFSFYKFISFKGWNIFEEVLLL